MLEDIAAQVGTVLLAKRKKLVTAESCTGGGLAAAITAIAGSSQWFERGFITYSNIAKIEMLGVMEKNLENFGAISKQTARQMAEGALQRSQAQVAIATTGIAGPGGGSDLKPVGMVCFAWAFSGNETKTTTQYFEGDRQAIRQQAIIFALETLLKKLD